MCAQDLNNDGVVYGFVYRIQTNFYKLYIIFSRCMYVDIIFQFIPQDVNYY